MREGARGGGEGVGDVPPSFRPIFDVPAFLAMTSRAQAARGERDPMKSNRRANPLQATWRVVPGMARALENDGAMSNWPAELRAGGRERPR